MKLTIFLLSILISGISFASKKSCENAQPIVANGKVINQTFNVYLRDSDVKIYSVYVSDYGLSLDDFSAYEKAQKKCLEAKSVLHSVVGNKKLILEMSLKEARKNPYKVMACEISSSDPDIGDIELSSSKADAPDDGSLSISEKPSVNTRLSASYSPWFQNSIAINFISYKKDGKNRNFSTTANVSLYERGGPGKTRSSQTKKEAHGFMMFTTKEHGVTSILCKLSSK